MLVHGRKRCQLAIAAHKPRNVLCLLFELFSLHTDGDVSDDADGIREPSKAIN